MGTTNPAREQLVRRALLQRTESVGSASAALWDQLTTELVSIIGHGGFVALYSRSIHLTGLRFTWLGAIQAGQATDIRFADLKSCLDRREATEQAEASEASILLLTTFIHILEALIGEPLTTSILQSAWGEDATDTPEKEVQQ